nr:hypothetical protein [Acetobacter persici]
MPHDATQHDDSGHFRQRLGLFDLTMIGFGSIFGSGWLFAAAHVRIWQVRPASSPG